MANARVEKYSFDPDAFRKKMESCPWTYEELSNDSGVSESTIYKALKEGRMSYRTYALLSSCIEIDIIGIYEESRK